MNLFLSSFVSYIPLVAICFVSVLFAYKIYVLIRSKFKILVNCWFCNHNLKVPYSLRNSWDCPNCEQYNGFTADGDYNCEIQAQLNCTPPKVKYAKCSQNYIPGNGLCETCNENQRIIVEKLAQFEPKNEKSFEKELGKYRSSLEQKYRLCVSCERHVSKILREKKKMILGSKLAAFVLGKVNILKSHPLLKQVKSSKTASLKKITSFTLFVLALINFGLLVSELTERRVMKGVAPEDYVSRILYMGISHLVTLVTVIAGYIQCIWKIKIIEKLYLYVKTMLALCFYTLGFKVGAIRFSLPVLVPSSLPFGSILLAFINNILDGFTLGRSTLLLTVWSICAGIVNKSIGEFYGIDVLKIVASIFTIVLSVPSFRSSERELLDSTTNSFHRIYSDDYFNDDSRENTSILNSTFMQNNSKNISLSSSGTSSSSAKSFTEKEFNPRLLSPIKRRVELSSPVTSTPSVFSKSFCSEDNTLITNHTNNQYQNSFLDTTMNLHKNDYNRPTSALSCNTSFVTCRQLIPENNFEYSVHKMNNLHRVNSLIENQQNRKFSIPTPSSNFLFSANHPACRPNVISPSRLNSKVYTAQASWVSGGYFNNQNKFGNKNYFLESSAPKDTPSRASSQSSGFESQGSSLSLQNGEQVFSRENSYCRDDCCPSQYDPHFDRFHNGRVLDNSIGLLPQCQSEKSFNSSFVVPNSYLPPAASPALSYQSLGSNYFANHTVSPSRTVRSSYSPFDLNKMNDDLPLIQKGGLLRKWKEQNVVL